MGKNRLTRLISASCLALFISTFAFGGATATVASAAAPGYLIPVYGTGLFSGKRVVNQVKAEYTLLGGRKSVTTLKVVPIRVSTWQRIPQNSSSTPATNPKPVPSVPANGNVEEQQALDLLNADRRANGLSPLRMNAQLTALAEDYAQDMINRGFFSHTNPEGQSPFDRMRQRGISYGYAGENLAINSSIHNAEDAFMNSPGHRANILNSNYTQVGLGVRHSPSGAVYVVQEFTDG